MAIVTAKSVPERTGLKANQAIAIVVSVTANESNKTTAMLHKFTNPFNIGTMLAIVFIGAVITANPTSINIKPVILRIFVVFLLSCLNFSNIPLSVYVPSYWI